MSSETTTNLAAIDMSYTVSIKLPTKTADLRYMRWPTTVAIGVCLLLAACTRSGTATEQAFATFGQFQAALFARDVKALHKLVTEESAPVIDELPFDRVRSQQQLLPVSASDERGSFYVHCLDPNSNNASGIYVVVRENGRFVVDLIATAGLHSQPTDRPVRPPEMTQRQLTPADHDRIRQRELAQPHGQPVR